MEAKLDQLITIVSQLVSTVDNIKGQLDENTQLVKALLHRTEELDAKYDTLLHTTATKDSIASLNNLLNDRLFQTEAKVEILSIVK